MMGDGTKRSFKELLGLARLPERTVPVCLRGDLRAEFERLERDLEQAREASKDSMAPPGAAELIERMDAIQAEMREATYPFVLRGLGSPKYLALRAKHPPRKGDDGDLLPEDRDLKVNVDTFTYDLVRKSVIDPVLDDDEFEDLLDHLTNYQYMQLAVGALELNATEVDVPFSLAASQMSRDTSAG